MFQFTQIAPLLGSKPIEELPASVFESSQIPEGVLSFTVNHGQYHFSKQGTIKQDPLRFILKLLMFFATILIYFLTRKTMEKSDIKKRITS